MTVVYRGGSKDDSGNFAAYINGQPLVLNTSVNSAAIPGRNEFGRNVNGSNGYVTGDLDEIRAYGRALRPQGGTTLSANPPTRQRARLKSSSHQRALR
ncbi:MAG: hypothetical protein EXS36_12615 [Pedosphaera sp.]|nr:hypothetical protein [Pedosphaera sp.]